ncbi:glucose 1-dehydrogenase [Thermobifida halotolerans]|uniref:Glucose 1-dehydrogenase n=1 Tax=Thermobifida halotolerans TaxID=483545 RepID=A0A399FYZ0_9ACTN|nr:glucose 1-dehydrogenase [Thermobifida halotolerans]UOE18652.1 glucose 1-dehydrogenase [Thermobifida halotolerans]
MTTLEGKKAVVTAGSRGIGRAISKRLAADGASVAINWHSNAEAAEELVQEITSEGGTAVAVQADMGVPADIERLFKEAKNTFGGIDVVVNNVGVNIIGPIAQIDEDEFDRAVAVNFKGTFLALKHAANMVSDGGRIINISTGNTRVTLPFTGVYAGTKAAVEQMGFSLAKELGPRQVTVNSVLPGLTDTEGVRPDIRANADGVIAMTPLGRMGRPEDIADVVAFLASDDARWITGQTIGVSGGLA